MAETFLDPLFNIFKKDDRKDLAKLEARAYLDFYYPLVGSDDSYKLIRVPFYENPEISEDKAAKYVSYMPVGRSSELFTYVGATARTIRLKFNFNLLHLMQYEINIDRFKAIISNDLIQSKQQLFFTSPLLLMGSQPAFIDQVQEEYNSLISDLDPVFAQRGIGTFHKNKVLETILFWINIVRTSVYNNHESPLYGPPIIRFSHGALYRSVPCICMKYSITFEDKNGYDFRTLFPRVMQITMELNEIRAGDFGKFEPGDRVKRDNLAGWEAVINDFKGTIDPQPYHYKTTKKIENE